MSFVRDLHTADAGSKTWDWLRVYGALTLVVGLVAFAACAIMGLPTDWILAYGTGFGGLLFGIAGGQAIRRDREAKPPGE